MKNRKYKQDLKNMKGKIFHKQEVQAIIAGNKTMFREVIKVQPTNENQVFSTVASSIRNKDIGTHNFINPKATWEQTKKFKCPYQVGQKIFVKESFYLAWKKRPAQHMKQEHSRLTLEITDVKIKRLADISEGDAIAEGLPLSKEFKDRYYTPENNYAVAKIAFMRWWNATHKKPEEKFDANPFVWVVDFKIKK